MRRTPIAFEFISEKDPEDHYVVTLYFRPQGDFEGTPGEEQFFINKKALLESGRNSDIITKSDPRRTPRSNCKRNFW